MKSPFFNIQPPYQLPSNIVYFHDWRYVNTGGYAWLGPKGEGVPMMAPGPVPAMHYEYRDMPLGIRLKRNPRTKASACSTQKQRATWRCSAGRRSRRTASIGSGTNRG
ncbi:MAG: hypothetical protein HY360_09925 [Verrucomicrobia bacterium]|nr:hypothetical protein [Verrucomicrobiota bacterium]